MDQKNADYGYHTLITKSSVIQEVLDIIEKAAKTDLSVLLLGESGVGKELFAEQVHLRSKRKNFPFVRVNCASLPEGLLESELFGHIKGAFTNAVSKRKGRFEAADGGTIFLDEIGDLPLTLQAKLLRVIQEKRFEKVGSDDTITVDVRIVAATNKELDRQVQNGLFREDLYYRLNVIPVNIPPLRRRQEDIAELAHFFLKSFMKKNKKHFEGFSEDALEAMLLYSWPGNVRELQNSIERACVTGKDKLIKIEDLMIKLPPESHIFDKGAIYYDEAEKAGKGKFKKTRINSNLKTAVNVFKAGFIRRVLEENNWNQTDASRALAIQRTYLSRLVKELKIEHPSLQCNRLQSNGEKTLRSSNNAKRK
ncbi:MAG: sigma 54-interacting transcriptional regulator [Spirochaetes bacterium]|nr:sigma 54-interacting transcriptional regulator [Brevinematales bacterium]MCL1960165.1 sigma 54-interacting transcriptional regulator [Spirochaetota bacterium]